MTLHVHKWITIGENTANSVLWCEICGAHKTNQETEITYPDLYYPDPFQDKQNDC